MKFETIQEQPKLVVRIKDTSTAFMNMLRRAVIADLPSFAVTTVNVYQNNSVMYNEYIANRVGLVPLTYDESLSPDTKISFTLDVEGPAMAYSRDMRSTDDKVRVFRDRIPVMKLGEGQRLKFEAIATIGTGRMHARWQNAIASYNGVPLLKGGKEGKACLVHARELGRTEASGGDCDYCKAEENGELKYSDKEFIFFVESYNNVSAKEQLETAIALLEKKAKQYAKESD